MTDYRMGFPDNDYIRHMALKDKKKSLCRVYSEFYSYSNLDENTQLYPDIYFKAICKRCFKKLPIKIQTEIKFRYMVYKLKK